MVRWWTMLRLWDDVVIVPYERDDGAVRDDVVIVPYERYDGAVVV